MIIVSLTTIPPRIKHLQSTINSLRNQSFPVDSIILHIPKHYHNYPDADELEIAQLKYVQINRCETDYGPATKLLAMKDFNMEEHDYIIVVDDDRMYEPDMVRDFIRSHINDPGKVYTQACWDISTLTNGEYSNGNILGGCCGFIIQRKDCPFRFMNMFTDLDHNDAKFYVDDVWLSGWIKMNGVQICGMPYNKPDAYRTKNDKICELLLRTDFPRTRSNTECAKYFHDKYNFYLKKK
jgi:hypothetical protein